MGLVMTWRSGVTLEPGDTWAGAEEWWVDVDGARYRALAYTDLVGPLEIGERVLLNSTAVDRHLGSGGYLFIVAPLDRLPTPTPGPGHIVKARYMPQQNMVLAVDEQDSPHHETVQDADGLDGMPVIVADLHSALPAIVATARYHVPDVRIAYVHTDTAALPIAFSKTAAHLKARGDITTITAGQSFGGDLEAVNLHTALLAARHVIGADIAVVVQGPGNVGTGTTWGFSGTAVGEAINAINLLGGTALATLRVSQADHRARHRGISHHSLTAYTKVALTPALVPTTRENIGRDILTRIEAHYPTLVRTGWLTLIEVSGIRDALEHSPVPLRTMGRGLPEDYAAFAFAGAGGVLAAQMIADARRVPPADRRL
ncbi:DUF3866 family protein [Flaviflexus huanghaiensis]|uniref:DUF3866 family protein n=1 Tax=Flaviflexus huanghaiensis TaxID=1111473 RepID=UPI001F50BCA8|nr:DUF3866 family protein [Flaviflexus huanghaiensis]